MIPIIIRYLVARYSREIVLPNCPVASQPSLAVAADLTPSSDLPDPTVSTYSLFAQDRRGIGNPTRQPRPFDPTRPQLAINLAWGL